MIVKNALLTTPWSQYLEPSELDMLMAHSNVVSFNPGDLIIEQGKYSSGIYIIVSGNAMLCAKTLDVKNTNIATLTKGDFVGEINLLVDEPYAISVIASTLVQCMHISNVYLNFLSLFYPETKYKILLALAHQICDRIKNTHKHIISILEHSDMTTQPFLGRVMTSLIKPNAISYEDAQISKDSLKSLEFFSFFTKEENEELLNQAMLIKAAKYCALINEGDKNPDCYIVLRGAVQSSIVHNHKVAKLSVIGPNILFCSISTVEAASISNVNFTTCEQTILLKITEATFNLVQKNNKQLWIKIFHLICKSLVALERSVQKLDIRLNVELYNR